MFSPYRTQVKRTGLFLMICNYPLSTPLQKLLGVILDGALDKFFFFSIIKKSVFFFFLFLHLFPIIKKVYVFCLLFLH